MGGIAEVSTLLSHGWDESVFLLHRKVFFPAAEDHEVELLLDAGCDVHGQTACGIYWHTSITRMKRRYIL